MSNVATHWKRLSPLLDAALDLPPSERAAWLAALPPEHADLRDRLRELLDTHPGIETGDFMRRLPEFSAVPAALKLQTGSVVGPYRLLQELGAGGTSTVWLAERVDGSIQRRIALKLPHLGLVDRGIAERIARECDILATLEHPNIARLYDAGVDERGRPYLALEYAQGVPPDQYCHTQRLDLEQKLTLFLNILRAVSFAHARLVVHRDLKPSNILVSEDCEVRLLDFGIARLLQPDAPRAPHTVVGAAALTPAYAAPEQFTGQPITVATDVYSLGVILFEMLTGISPYTPRGTSLGAYEHAVVEVEPPLMSRVVRPAEVGALRGDLDAIVAKALEKAPADRYISAEAFAADIERYLAAEPIVARPRSLAYVSRKFLRRNAWPMSIGAAVLLALSAALGVAAVQWQDAEKQRAIAVDRLADSLAAEDFTSTVLIENIQPGQTLTFEQLIARSEQIARDTGANDLRTRIFATDFLSSWYSANGLYRNAEMVLTGTINTLPADQPLVGATLRCRRAKLWDELGDRDDAVAVLDGLIAEAGADDVTASRCLMDRSSVAASNADAPGALAFAFEAQRRYDNSGVDSVFDHAAILTSIGGAYGILGQFDEAHDKYRETLRLFEAAGRGNSRAAASLHDDWGTVYMNAGNPRRALEELDLGWRILSGLAPAARETDRLLARRARILATLGDYDGALVQFRQAAALAEPRGNLSNVATIRIGEADVHIQAGQLAQASLDLDAAARAIAKARLAPASLIAIRYRLTRAEWLAAHGDREEARTMLTNVIAAYDSQKCCAATRSLAYGERALLAIALGELDAAAADAATARELAPPDTTESFSRFTGGAWYATALIAEKRGALREARDAFAKAAVQYAGAVGESHADTLRARAGIARAANRLSIRKDD
ncbi:MAG TPA: serine/threonine-protein kinase [Steroidobacteraceae bacterium]|nr:serine/threonine-protein kinase [Steroidobacteraceae bacterium]